MTTSGRLMSPNTGWSLFVKYRARMSWSSGVNGSMPSGQSPAPYTPGPEGNSIFLAGFEGSARKIQRAGKIVSRISLPTAPGWAFNVLIRKPVMTDDPAPAPDPADLPREPSVDRPLPRELPPRRRDDRLRHGRQGIRLGRGGADPDFGRARKPGQARTGEVRVRLRRFRPGGATWCWRFTSAARRSRPSDTSCAARWTPPSTRRISSPASRRRLP